MSDGIAAPAAQSRQLQPEPPRLASQPSGRAAAGCYPQRPARMAHGHKPHVRPNIIGSFPIVGS
jgi:hypothetical protein